MMGIKRQSNQVRSMIPRWLTCITVVLFMSFAVEAHDPFEAIVTLTIRPTNLELEIVIARTTGTKLLGDGAPKAADINSDTFEKVRPLLLEKSASWITLKLDDAALSSQATEAILDEGDFVIRSKYQRPPHGRLRIIADYLQSLPDDYAANTSILDSRANILATDLLKRDGPSALETNLRAAETAPTPSPNLSHPPAPGIWLIILGGVLMAAGVVVFVTMRKS